MTKNDDEPDAVATTDATTDATPDAATPAGTEPSGASAQTAENAVARKPKRAGKRAPSDTDARASIDGDDAATSERGSSGASAPPPRPRTPRALGAAALATVALMALDLGSKAWAESRLSSPRVGEPPTVCETGPSGYAPYQRVREDPIVFIEGVLELEYAENCGAAFSLFGDMPGPLRHAIFYVAALLATLILARMYYQGKGGRFFAVAVPLVISGALGNFHDRLRFGYVVDFIHAHWASIGFDYPIFNVADIAVVVGVIALVIDSFRERRETAPALAGPAGSEKPA